MRVSSDYLTFLGSEISSDIPRLNDEVKNLKNLLRTELREVAQIRSAIDMRMRRLDECIIKTADKIIAGKIADGESPSVTAQEILAELYNRYQKISPKHKSKWDSRAVTVRIYTVLRHNGYARDLSQTKSARCVRYQKVKNGNAGGKRSKQ